LLAVIYQQVHIHSVAHVLPTRVVSSLELEQRLAPCYERLGFHPGRIELMSGIAQRRHYPAGTRPSAIATEAAEKALAGFDRSKIGALIFASVCRDFMEPATATVVHKALGLPPTCQPFDLSNACLGFGNAMLMAATMLELGQTQAVLVVAGEDGGPLVEATIKRLNEDPAVTRKSSKLSFASLTIGSGGAAMLLTRQPAGTPGHRLLGGQWLADTSANHLCQGGLQQGVPGAQAGPLMETDSEVLMQEGVKLAQRVWARTRTELGWTNADVDRLFTHQVGVAHRKLLFERLELDGSRDYPTVETLGNIGSVSLPLGLSCAVQENAVANGQKLALLGIGSGLVCLNLGVQW